MSADPWAAFWNSGGASVRTASLADLSPLTQARLDAPWRDLARALPRRASVLDLATGGGVVLDLLRLVRPDLKLTGVDAAKRLPVRPGMALKAGVKNERLPFPAAHFAAVTSRFGIEYGDLAASAREAVRVLRHGGQLTLILHHADGVVLHHNLARLEALRWAAIESGWLDRATEAARQPVLGGLPRAAPPRPDPAEAAARFPGQTVVLEFLAGLNQVLDAAPAQVLGGLQILRERAEGEIARLEELASAACDAERIELLGAAFGEAGVEVRPPEVLTDANGVVLAWYLAGQRQ